MPFALPPKPAIIIPKPAELVKPGSPEFRVDPAFMPGIMWARSVGSVDYVTNGLVTYLDASNGASYPGSGQTWTDIGGGGNNFLLGATSSSEASDPTFNSGTPSYFSFAGGQWFTQSGTPSGTLPQLVGRSDTTFTAEFWVWFASVSSASELFCNGNFGANGIQLGTALTVAAALEAFPVGGTDPSPLAKTGVTTSAWHQVVFTVLTDSATTCTLYVDGTAVDSSTLHTSWTTGNSAGTPRIGARPDNSASLPSGTRISIVRLYDRILSSTEVTKNLNTNRMPFGI
jgi:hypothetical protein